MREIKFRAWDGKKMHYNVAVIGGKAMHRVFLVHSHPSEENPTDEREIMGSGGGRYYADGATFHPVKDAALMQFTGVRDGDGREVYEGDILEYSGYPCRRECLVNYRYTVEWSDQGVMYDCSIWRVSDRVRGAACGAGLCEVIQEPGVRVVGNIHDNPELLEVAE